MKKFLLFPAVAFFILQSCSNTKKTTDTQNNVSASSGSEKLYQQQWNLVELNGATVTENVKAHLLFTAGQVNKVTGNTGCNILNGSVELSGENNLKFSPIATSRRACLDNGIADTEKNFLAALATGNNWSIDNNNLFLKNGKVVIAKFSGVKILTSGEKKLNGNWRLNFIAGSTATLDSLFPNKKPTLLFNLPGTNAGGNSGCNGFGSTLQLEGNRIHFSNILSTMIACQGYGESLFFKQLELVSSYLVDDTTLQLKAGETVVMRFVKQ